MAWLNDMRRDRCARSVAGAAFVFGVALPVVAAIEDLNPLWVLVTGVVPGAAFVVVGIWATKRPEQLTSVVGAAVGALSAPAYYLLLSDARHPLDAGADIGRGLVGLVVPFILPFDMMLGAWAAARIETRGAAGSGSSAGIRLAMRVLALVIGLGACWSLARSCWRRRPRLRPSRGSLGGSCCTTALCPRCRSRRLASSRPLCRPGFPKCAVG